MAMSNPFLKVKPKHRLTLGSELVRLFGGIRSLWTLIFLIIPLLLSLAGGVDYVLSWYYAFVHHTPTDERTSVFFLDCVTNNPDYQQVCSGNNTPAWSTTHKLQYWPFTAVNDDRFFGWARGLGHPQPFMFAILFAVAFLAFVSIGNPRFRHIRTTLGEAFGIRRKHKKSKGGTLSRFDFDNELLPPPKLTELVANWIVGGTVFRQWESDPGYFYTDEKSKANRRILTSRPPYFLTAEILRTNLMIVAPQGSGKTTSIFRPAISFIARSGGCAFVWDSKGNDFEGSDFTYNFDLEDFEHSFKLVVFSGKTPEEAGERLGEALIPETSEDKKYFSDVAKDTLASIVAAHFAVTSRYPELRKLLLYINKESKGLDELIDQVQKSVKDKDEAERLTVNLNSIKGLAEIKGDPLGNLRLALAPLTTPQISRFLVANKDNVKNAFTVEELLGQPGLIRLGLAISDRPKVAPTIGRLILAQFVFTVLSPSCNKNILKLAIVDEARHFASLPTCNGMAQARSNNAGFMLAFQALSQITDNSMLETIFSLAGTKLVMSGVGDKDADRFSRTFGKVWLEHTSHSASSGTSTNSNAGGSRSTGSFLELGTSSESGSKSSLTTNYGRGNARNKGEGRSVQLQQRELFSSYEIRSLPQYHAIIETSNTYGQRWQAQIIDMSKSTVQSLEEAFTKVTTKKVKGEKRPGPAPKALPMTGQQKVRVATQAAAADSGGNSNMEIVEAQFVELDKNGQPIPAAEPLVKFSIVPATIAANKVRHQTEPPTDPTSGSTNTNTIHPAEPTIDRANESATAVSTNTNTPQEQLGTPAKVNKAIEKDTTSKPQYDEQEIAAIKLALVSYRVDVGSSDWMARKVVDNGRSIDYVHALAKKPNTLNLPGWLNRAICDNIDPPKSQITT